MKKKSPQILPKAAENNVCEQAYREDLTIAPHTLFAPFSFSGEFSLPLAVVDLETTGLNSRQDRVIEIGVLLFDQQFRFTGKFSTFINPQRVNSASFVNKISQSELENAPVFAALAPQLAKLLSQRIIVAHNAAFDLKFLNAEFARCAVQTQLSRKKSICTLEQSRIYCPPGSHSLQNLALRCGLTNQPAHRALQDAYTTAELLALFLQREAAGIRYTEQAFNRDGTAIFPSKYICCAAKKN